MADLCEMQTRANRDASRICAMLRTLIMRDTGR
jgi:hypothetical protein